MRELVNLIQNYQQTNDNMAFKMICDKVKLLMLRYLKKIPIQYQEDMQQEFYIVLYTTIIRFKIDNGKDEKNNKQFLKILQLKFQYKIADFYKDYKKEQILMELYLKKMINEKRFNKDLEDILLQKGLSKKEIQFIMEFIENEQIINQTKVARKLKVSQQTVSRKIKEIKEKYKKK